MNKTTIDNLLHIKSVIDRLKAIDQDMLTPAEREACNDTLAQAYDRAAYLLAREEIQRLLLPQTPSSSLATHAGCEQGTASADDSWSFFCLFIVYESIPHAAPATRHPKGDPAFPQDPPHVVLLLLPIKRQKNEGHPGDPTETPQHPQRKGKEKQA